MKLKELDNKRAFILGTLLGVLGNIFVELLFKETTPYNLFHIATFAVSGIGLFAILFVIAFSLEE